MTTQLPILKERLEEIAALEIKTTSNGYDFAPGAISTLRTAEMVAMARALLAAYEQEPVYQVLTDDGRWAECDKRRYDRHETVPEQRRKLYTHPAPSIPAAVPTFEDWCESREQNPTGWDRYIMKEAYDACRAAMLQAEPVKVEEPQQPGSQLITAPGWTGNGDANSALVMLDRIDTLSPEDDDRIEDVKRIIRSLAAEPKGAL